MSELKVGDVVKLRSGGLPMTVEKVDEDGVWIVWFDGGEMRRGWLECACLTIASSS